MNKIVAIGGGTGLSILLAGLKNYFQVTAVVTVGDNGGGSGILREDLNMLPPGDVRNCLLALSEAPEELRGLLNYRFIRGSLKGQSLGNLMLAAMSEEYGSFRKAVAVLSSLLKLKGLVLPVSSSAMDLSARLSDGSVVLGESEIAKAALARRARIEEIYLQAEVPLLAEVVEAIEEAEFIVLGPGSLYTSVIANLLVGEMPQLLAKKKIVYICNLMTQREETANYSLGDHVLEIERYLKRPVDIIIGNQKMPPADVLEAYRAEESEPVKITPEERKYFGRRLILDEFLEVKNSYIRSAADKIGERLLELYADEDVFIG
ncbi:MAG: YvcK family protein [Eubacteriales bacterium]|nr:YvcK family protein [Eubacteriales bacterium]